MSNAAVTLDTSERHYRCVRFQCLHCPQEQKSPQEPKPFVHHIESVMKKHLKRRHPGVNFTNTLRAAFLNKSMVLCIFYVLTVGV